MTSRTANRIAKAAVSDWIDDHTDAVFSFAEAIKIALPAVANGYRQYKHRGPDYPVQRNAYLDGIEALDAAANGNRPTVADDQCIAITRTGANCTRKGSVLYDHYYCVQHGKATDRAPRTDVVAFGIGGMLVTTTDAPAKPEPGAATLRGRNPEPTPEPAEEPAPADSDTCRCIAMLTNDPHESHCPRYTGEPKPTDSGSGQHRPLTLSARELVDMAGQEYANRRYSRAFLLLKRALTRPDAHDCQHRIAIGMQMVQDQHRHNYIPNALDHKAVMVMTGELVSDWDPQANPNQVDDPIIRYDVARDTSAWFGPDC